MASFSAELRVAGHAFPVVHCQFGVEQATHQRGRVSTKVRYSPVQLVLAVPEGEVLFAWATDAHKRQAAQVHFRDANGGSVVETLELKAAYCVRYHEQFVSGDAQGGAYQCVLTLSDPDGWTLSAGGPATAFVAPAAREHGRPGAVGDIVGSGLRNVAIAGGPVASTRSVAAPTTQEKARLAMLNRVREKQALAPAEEQELLALLATVQGIHVPQLAQLTPKPKHSPDPTKWRAKGGRIDVLANGFWKYTDHEGNEVTYEPDEPNFDKYARQQVDIEDMQGDCTSDFVKADEKAALGPFGPKEDTSTWHHKNNLRTMQEVPRKIHSRFTHYGARSIIKKQKAPSAVATSTGPAAGKSVLRKKKV